MKTNRISVWFLCALFFLTNMNVASAQSRHLYHRLELGGGNTWSCVGMTVATAFINTLAERPIAESSLRFSFPSSDDGVLNTFQGTTDFNGDYETPEGGSSDFFSFGADYLFCDILVGEKIGYLTDNRGYTNFCLYGAAYYNRKNLKRGESYYDLEDYTKLTMRKAQFGGGLMVIFGSIENTYRLILDGGIRYNIPLSFSAEGYDNTASDTMGKGLSSHYMAKVSLSSATSVGFTFDMLHYDLFKDYNVCGGANLYEVGINVCILIN